MFKKPLLILVLILVLAAGLRLWQANTFDIYTDHALYAFRALSWSDFIGVSDKQTTPLSWYPTVPGWSRLSFSDGPPLGFALEYLSLNIFGTSPLGARLPFILVSLFILVLLFFGIKRLVNERASLIAALIWAISSYGVWTALAGNLEGILILFVTTSIITSALYRQEPKLKWFYLWALSLALGLLTKYTVIFIIPAGLVIMFWPQSFKINFKINLPPLKHLFIASLMFVTLLSPVIIYNYHVYETRGHFDAALSSMVGMKPQDFIGIANRGADFSPVINFKEQVKVLSQINSKPFLFLFVISFLFLSYQFYRRRASSLVFSILSHLVFLVIMLLFLSSASRFLSVFIPMIVLVIALSLDEWWSYFSNKQKSYYYSAFTIVSLILIGELLYNINTNVLTKPVLTAPNFYAPDRYYDLGFYQLEKWFRQNSYPVLPPKEQLKTIDDLDLYPDNIAGRSVIVYDDSTIWSGRIWHLERYKTLYNLPIIPISYLYEQGPKANEFLRQLLALSGQTSYFVYAPNPINLDSVRSNDPVLKAYVKEAVDNIRHYISEPQLIKGYNGETVFEIYRFKL